MRIIICMSSQAHKYQDQSGLKGDRYALKEQLKRGPSECFCSVCAHVTEEEKGKNRHISPEDR